MTDLQLFQNEQFGQIRVIKKDGEPWFVAADVCSALDLSNSSQTISYLDDDERGVTTNETLGGPQQMAIINEPGLYSLVLRSRKPEAKAFKRWICHEVIPAIRKTGGYKASPRRSQSELNAREASRCLRMMAKMNVYPAEMQAIFTAKAVVLLTGEPLQALLPPIRDNRESWRSPTELGAKIGVNRNAVGRALKAQGLHGDDDVNHEWSQPIWNKSQHSNREVVSYLYNPAVVIPALEKALCSDRPRLN